MPTNETIIFHALPGQSAAEAKRSRQEQFCTPERLSGLAGLRLDQKTGLILAKNGVIDSIMWYCSFLDNVCMRAGTYEMK
jgi:hypothetical protein